MRRALEYAARPRRHPRRALRGRARSPAGGHMHEGAWSSRLGRPGDPCRGRAGRWRPRHRPRAGSPGRRCTSCTCRRPARCAVSTRRRRDGLPVTAEVTPHHLALTDAAVAGLRPALQGEPAAADAPSTWRRSAPACASGWWTRSRPTTRPIHPRRRTCPSRRLLRGCSASRRRSPSPWARWCSRALTPAAAMPLRNLIALMSLGPCADRRHLRRPGRRQGGPVAVGLPANLCVIDPDQTWTVDAERLSSRSRNTPFDGVTLTGKVRHTIYLGEPVVVGGKARAMSDPLRSCGRPRQPAHLVLADGEVFEGEAAGASHSPVASQPASSCSTPAMSGYQEVLTDPSYAGQVICFTYPHIGNYGVNSLDNEASRAVVPGLRRARPSAAGRPTGGRAASFEEHARAPRDPRHHGRRHPARHPPGERPRVRCGCAFGTASVSELCGGGGPRTGHRPAWTW